MDDALDKLQKIRNEVNALNPSDENAHRLELSIREAIRLIRKAEKIDKPFREKCVQDLDYEIIHYLHQNYRKAVTKGEKNIEFNRARQGAVLAINRTIHRMLNGK
jgi:DNA repair ATPase RecN